MNVCWINTDMLSEILLRHAKHTKLYPHTQTECSDHFCHRWLWEILLCRGVIQCVPTYFVYCGLLWSCVVMIQHNRCDHWPWKALLILVPELTEFVLQLDEEVEGMQATMLHFESAKNSGGSTSPLQMEHTPSSSAPSSKGSKERTKGITNGPVESGSNSTNSSSKT